MKFITCFAAGCLSADIAAHWYWGAGWSVTNFLTSAALAAIIVLCGVIAWGLHE